MKKFLVFVLIVGLIAAGYFFFKKDFIKKDDVTVKDCLNCNYVVNDTEVTIKDGVVSIGGNDYTDIKQIKAVSSVIILIKDNGVIGYKGKEVFSYSDGFDSSYPGMKIEGIKINNSKISIQTTRLIDKYTMDVGKKFQICANDVLNYSGMNSLHLNVNEPVKITYEIDLEKLSEPTATYKLTLGTYFKQLGNCKTS